MKLRMLDETEGNIKEVMIYLNGATKGFAKELGDKLPNARLILPCAQSLESLTHKLGKAAEEAKVSVAEARSLLDYLSENPNFISVIARDEITAKTYLASEEARATSPEQRTALGRLRSIYERTLQDKSYAAFMSLFVLGLQKMALPLKEQDITDLSSRPKTRVIRTPYELSPFARDRFIAASVDGKKGIIQGKLDEGQLPAVVELSRRQEIEAVSEALPGLGFLLVPSYKIDLRRYNGGDILVAGDSVFIGNDTLERNMNVRQDETRARPLTLQETIGGIQKLSGRARVCVVRLGIWDEDLDLMIDPLSNNRVIVGSMKPTMGLLERKKLLQKGHLNSYQMFQSELDGAAEGLTRSGYRVKRVPLYAFFDPSFIGSRRYRCGANNIKNGNQVIWAHFGTEFGELDEETRAVYAGEGYDSVNISSLGFVEPEAEKAAPISRLFCESGVRCVANVLSRG